MEQWNGKGKTEYSLSSESTPRLTISDVLFCRRNNFCLAWHLDIWAAQSTWTFALQIRHRRPCLVWPFFGREIQISDREINVKLKLLTKNGEWTWTHAVRTIRKTTNNSNMIEWNTWMQRTWQRAEFLFSYYIQYNLHHHQWI